MMLHARKGTYVRNDRASADLPTQVSQAKFKKRLVLMKTVSGVAGFLPMVDFLFIS